MTHERAVNDTSASWNTRKSCVERRWIGNACWPISPAQRIKSSCCATSISLPLSKLILFGEAALRQCLISYLAHYHGERNHQGKENVILFPSESVEGSDRGEGPIRCRESLRGLLKYYYRYAALVF